MMRRPGLSFRTVLAAAFFAILAVNFAFVYAIHVRLIEVNALEQMKIQVGGQAEAISHVLQGDLVSGFYPAVVQRAGRLLLSQPNLSGIKVEMKNGYVVFEQINGPPSKEHSLVILKRVQPPTPSGDASLPQDWVATITTQFSLGDHAALMRSQRRSILILSLILTLLALAMSAFLSETLSRPIMRLAQEMNRGDLRSLQSLALGSAAARVGELSELYSRTHELAQQNLRYQSEIVRSAKEGALAEQARQVAHDIRSPLAALDTILESFRSGPESDRLIVRGAINRIRDIANGLLDKGLERGRSASPSQPHPHLLSSLIDPLVSEKRLQYKDLPGISISAPLTSDSYGLFASVDRVEFNRVLSNLVDNAVEALDGRGKVVVSMAGKDDLVLIRVTDDGKGIPLALLPSLGTKGATFSKPAGSGLGLYHARAALESWGGRLEIHSGLGAGTEVLLTLPRATIPEWFVPQLGVGEIVVALDDDPNVHEVWRSRMRAIRGAELLHFTDAAALRAWARSHPEQASKAVFLLDYELADSQDTGLTLVREGLSGRGAILVTSRYDEPAIIHQCRELGVRVIPKSLAPFVPVAIVDRPSEQARAILLDDDPLVRAVWAAAAKEKGLSLEAFRSPVELMKRLDTLPKDAQFYFDVDLGNGVRGDEVARELYAKGYKRLAVTTGYDASRFLSLPWVELVIGKDPPW